MRGQRRAVLAVFAFSLAIRIVWASFAHVTPLSDFEYYQGFARHLLANGTYAYGDKSAWIPPGYPVFLAGAYDIFGEGRLGIGMVQAALGSLSSALVVVLGARVFSTRVGLLAGMLHAVSPTMLAYIPALASENLAIPLLLGTLLAVESSGARQGRRAWAWAALGGLCCGLLLLTRSSLLFVIPACVLLLLYAPRARSWSLAKPFVFVVVIGLTLIPWTARNYRVGLGFMPFTSSGGAGLYIANSDTGLNGEWGEPSFEFVQGMSEGDRARAYSQAANEWIRKNPGRYLALCRTRLARLLGPEADAWAARMLRPTLLNDRALVAEFAASWDGKPAPAELLARAQRVVAHNTRFLYRLNVLLLSPLTMAALILAVVQLRRTALVALPVIFYLGGLGLTIASMRYRLMSDPLVYILIAALLCDAFRGTENLGSRPGRWLKLVLMFLWLNVSALANLTGLADRLYSLPPIPVSNPDVSGYTFSSADLNSAAPTWVCRTEVQVKRKLDGLLCTVSGTKDTSAAQYGGVLLPIGGADACRLDLELSDTENVVRVFVDFSDKDGNRLQRWQWDAKGVIKDGEHRAERVFLPGHAVGRFSVQPPSMAGIAANVHVFLEIAPGSRAALMIHEAQAGRSVANSAPALERRASSEPAPQ